MKRFLQLAVCLLVLLLFGTSCEYKFKGKHRTILLENRSSLPLIAFERSGYDTIVTGRSFIDKDRYYVSPNSNNSQALKRIRWGTYEDLFTYHQYCLVFILNANDVRWSNDHLSDLDSYLVRYDFTLEDLQDLDWRISFPPNDSMKTISMWPPFEDVVAKYKE